MGNGRSKEYNDYHGGDREKTALMQERVQRTRDEQGGRCPCCGEIPDHILQGHHLNYRRPFSREERWDIIALCGWCHPVFDAIRKAGRFLGTPRGWAINQREKGREIPYDDDAEVYYWALAKARQHLRRHGRGEFYSTAEMKERDAHDHALALSAGRTQAQVVRLPGGAQARPRPLATAGPRLG